MIYEYTVINADSAIWAVKRAAIYLAILIITISTALVVLYILFERYLSLIACAMLYLFSILTMVVVGRRKDVYTYALSADGVLTIRIKSGTLEEIDLKCLVLIKNAEYSDFLQKSTIKYAFINSNTVLKNGINKNSNDFKNVVLTDSEHSYILSADNYVLSFATRS